MASVLTVIGATGKQGSSVVNAALKNGTYKIRAVTRNLNSEKAKALATLGVELVTADVNDEHSLLKAFEGSTAIYAVTAFSELFVAGGPEHAMKVEFEQGRNIANAAAKTSSLKHFIWSTLPNAKKISNGKYLVPHFEGKNRVDEYIKANAALYAKTTFLWLTYFAQNYSSPMFTPNFVKTSGKYVQLQPVSPTVPIFSIGDITKNLGKFTSAILDQPQLTHGKYVLAYVEKIPVAEILEIWSLATEKPAVYVQVSSLKAFDNVWPKWGHELGIMMQFWEEYGDDSWSGEEVLTSHDLGIKGPFVGIKETFENTDWSSL